MADINDKGPGEPGSDIKPVSITDEMKRSYLDYAMSVIVSRALPDVRDGLKPVHRRILYSMYENGLHAGQALYEVGPHRRRRDGQIPSARRPGDLRRAGAHGAAFLHAPAADRRAGQFRLGRRRSSGGDALYRVRASTKVAHWRSSTISTRTRSISRTTTTAPNSEPVVLPARFPNLLVNGAGGIAVGMATNIPPHNLGEVIDACIALIDDPDIASTT